MLRNQWEFKYTVEALRKAAQIKVERHSTRREFWKEKQAKLMAEIKEKGLTIVESEGGTTYGSKFGNGPQVAIDFTYQQRLAETSGKIKEHHGKLEAYKAWVVVLEAAPADDKYALHHDDYLFFFG